MSSLNRRNFLSASAASAASCLGAACFAGGSAGPVALPQVPQVPLGNTGITLSRVGQGTGMRGGNRQSNHTRMGFDAFKALIQRGMEHGITFFDMADLYGTHLFYREAMRSILGSQAFGSVKREDLTLLTKIWWRYDLGGDHSQAEPWCKRVCTSTVERFCHELGTEYVDIVLLHCLTSKDWVAQLEPYMDALSEAKEKGKIKAVGVSCHHLDALEVSADCPWVDVILARINPAGASMDGEPDRVVPVLRRARANGKAIIGMKIFGEGKLADRRESCVEYAQQLGLLDTMTIGFEEPRQIDQVCELLHKYPAAPLA